MSQDLSPLDLYKLIKEQVKLEALLRESHRLVQSHLRDMDFRLTTYINTLSQLPPSQNYSIEKSEYRAENSFEYAWVIELNTWPIKKRDPQAMFPKERPKHSFKITVTKDALILDRSDTGLHKTHTITTKTKDGKTEIDQQRQSNAVNALRAEFASWIVSSCPEHAGIFFIRTPTLLPSDQKLEDDQRSIQRRRYLQKPPRP